MPTDITCRGRDENAGSVRRHPFSLSSPWTFSSASGEWCVSVRHLQQGPHSQEEEHESRQYLLKLSHASEIGCASLAASAPIFTSSSVLAGPRWAFPSLASSRRRPGPPRRSSDFEGCGAGSESSQVSPGIEASFVLEGKVKEDGETQLWDGNPEGTRIECTQEERYCEFMEVRDPRRAGARVRTRDSFFRCRLHVPPRILQCHLE